jgi:hypothetical protein
MNTALVKAAFQLIGRPQEALDRIRVRREAQISLRGERSATATADPEWLPSLHRTVGAEWPCPLERRFEELWSTIQSDLADSTPWSIHDSDESLGRACWCLVLHTRPQNMVETGVGRGLTTRIILEAMAQNGSGHLWSIDLPPIGLLDQSGMLVVPSLKERWTYRRGSVRRLLPGLLLEIGTVDGLVFDSLHTELNVGFELEEGWSRLAGGGFALVDDIDDNQAFDRFRNCHSAISLVGAQSGVKTGLFGIAFKPTLEEA